MTVDTKKKERRTRRERRTKELVPVIPPSPAVTIAGARVQHLAIAATEEGATKNLRKDTEHQV
jgi:hypothetical protein